MKRSGISNLPLHGGHAPPWLFERMKGLSRGITEAICLEYSTHEFLRRISDPNWFQAFSCVLGFDWYSSGTTTVTLGALKEVLETENIGLAVCGGKGKSSRKTPSEIFSRGERMGLSDSKLDALVKASRMTAKVDSAALQDGYGLYHHNAIFDENGKWTVIQQGLNTVNKYARRYHWLSDDLESFTCDPHSAITCENVEDDVLNMVSKFSRQAQKISVDLACDGTGRIRRLVEEAGRDRRQGTLSGFLWGREIPVLDMPKSIRWSALDAVYDKQPSDYEELISGEGIGPAAVRALALIADIIYGKPADLIDPVKFNYAHGGKDGVPYPVDRRTYDRSIDMLREAIDNAKVGDKERINAVKRLNGFFRPEDESVF